MRKILAVLLSLTMLLGAAGAETSQEAYYTPETVLPLVANNRSYSAFTRGTISSGEEAIAQAKLWLNLPLLVTNFPASSEAADWTAMQTAEGWYVTAYMRGTFVWALLDAQGRLQAYDFDLLENASLAYDGMLPDNLDEAMQSYIQRFASLNDLGDMTGYTREAVTTYGEYAVAVTAQATLGNTPYRFTMRLDMMAFTAVENLSLHQTAAQTQRDVLLLMRDDLAEKGVDLTQVFYAVQVEEAEDETRLTGIASFRAEAASDAILQQYGTVERYTLHYRGSAAKAGIEEVTLSDWRESVAKGDCTLVLPYETTLYALVDGKYLVAQAGLQAGTSYVVLDEMQPQTAGVIPLETNPAMTRIRYLRDDKTAGSGWVRSDALNAESTDNQSRTENPIPTLENYEISVDGKGYSVFAINKAEKGYDTFGDLAGTKMPISDVLKMAAQRVIATFGVDAEELLCSAVVEYGYRTDNACWQVNFEVPQRDMADDAYEVEVDDKDGKVTGIWGPQDGNG